MMFEVKDEVRVKGTDIEGIITRIGQTRLLMIDITTPHSAFDRNVFGEWELEKIGGNKDV
ncbi:hypothetical protein [Clostridium sp. UBA4395]|uniref:hypothetical protein n=1 Tax=Clostridium sp. UBA4395 TaxID=1946360 RepID=UPI003216FC89